jgi:tetratricopeptide (TPR) repeat protein
VFEVGVELLTQISIADKGITNNDNMVFLVIDDMRNMRKTIKNMLNHIGYNNILEASDGDHALNILKSRVDFVICDWNMTSMSGIEVLKKVREDNENKNIPFLMVTAEVDISRILQAAETEVDGYIVKPFVSKTLENKINNILTKKLNPDEYTQILSIAEKQAADGLYEDAIAAYEDALRIKPDSAKVRYMLGEIYEKKSEKDKAFEYYETAFKLNSKFIKIHDKLSDLYIEKGELSKAKEVVEKFLEINPDCPNKQVQLGRVLFVQGDTATANKLFRTSMARNPNNNEIRLKIGDVYLNAGHNEEAEEVFRESIRLAKDIHTYNRLGLALRQRGKHMEAVEEYKKALQLEPDNENVYFNMGRAYMDAGEKSKAVSSFKKALELEPGFKECSEILVSLAAKQYIV